jgi:hypothetical protein
VVLAIPKPKKQPSDPRLYRPISLLPALSKIMERTVKTRLVRHANKEKIIPNEQFGFRKKHLQNAISPAHREHYTWLQYA